MKTYYSSMVGIQNTREVRSVIRVRANCYDSAERAAALRIDWLWRDPRWRVTLLPVSELWTKTTNKILELETVEI